MTGCSARRYETNYEDVFDFQIFVKKAADVDAPAALAAVERAAEEYPGSKVLDQTEYKEDQTQFVDQILGLGTRLLAILIALLGIQHAGALDHRTNTRTRCGCAVGMNRSQLRSMIRWESVIIAPRAHCSASSSASSSGGRCQRTP